MHYRDKRGAKVRETAFARANAQDRGWHACVDMGGQKPILYRGCIGRGQLARLALGNNTRVSKGKCRGRGQLA